MNAIYVVGDVHGHLTQLVGLLADADLLDPDALWRDRPAWTGGTATLWFMGDFTDRGPSGIGVLDLVMRLQREAAAVGGSVQSLLGNHEILLVAAARFGSIRTQGGPTFLEGWQLNGGKEDDLAALTAQHIAWIGHLPMMAQVAERLLIHADSLLYLHYGDSVAAVNKACAAILASADPTAHNQLLNAFTDRAAFIGNTGAATAKAFLMRYGGRQLIHGHTPIAAQTGQAPATVTGPLVYADGLCVNVDPALYRGGPGFVYRLPPLP